MKERLIAGGQGRNDTSLHDSAILFGFVAIIAAIVVVAVAIVRSFGL